MKTFPRAMLLLVLILLALVACSGTGAQTEPTVESAATPVAEPATATSEPEPTAPPATATEQPATATLPPPTDAPTLEPTATDEPPTATPTPAAVAPSITVSDQAIVDGTIAIGEAVLADGGWMVIHLDVDGSPGPVIGFAPLDPGANEDVVVDIDVSQATPSLIAMLHVDDGTIGDYEFPNADPPVMLDGAMVVQSFAVSGLETATEEAMPTDLVEIAIQGFSFDPGSVTIPVGTTVVWRNMGGTSHTVTADDRSFVSDTLSNGGTFEFTFLTPGTYAYYCEFHGRPGGEGMSAVITVTQ